MVDSYTAALQRLSFFLEEYNWLLDCYIIEYFTEDHWNKLPLSWRESLYTSDCCKLKELVQFILGQKNTTRIYPLSFLAFITTCHSLASTSSTCASEEKACPATPTTTSGLSAQPTSAPISKSKYLNLSSTANPSRLSHPLRADGCGLSHPFRRHIRPKKQHEIEILGKVIADLSRQTNCKNVLDIGSGQGHLARYLAYNYGLSVVTIDAVCIHATAASKYDSEVERDFQKAKQSQECGQIHHVTGTVGVDTSVRSLLKMTSLSGQFILVGLHTCGDLAPTILRLFSQSSMIVGVASVGCCYMKLTTDGNPLRQCLSAPPPHPSLSSDPLGHTSGYPMSMFMESECPLWLSYEARELACHAIEAIRGKFEGTVNLQKYKVHCHRAAVEIILRNQYGLCRTQVRMCKRISKLPFRQYSEKILQLIDSSESSSRSKLKVIKATSLGKAAVPSGKEMKARTKESDSSCCNLHDQENCSLVTNGDNKRGSLGADILELECLIEKEWMNVLIFFMLRQALAPCVEQVILLDRVLFLLEQGRLQTSLYKAFDSTLSPRNKLILATRTNM